MAETQVLLRKLDPSGATNGQVPTFNSGSGDFEAQTPVAASETVEGVVELATDVEAQGGTDTARPVVPSAMLSAVRDGAAFAATTTNKGSVEIATKSEMEGETANKVPDAAILRNHKGIAKAWAHMTMVGTHAILNNSSHNISSVTTIGGAGVGQVNFSTGFPKAEFVAVGLAVNAAGNGANVSDGAATLVGTNFRFLVESIAGTDFDSPNVRLTFFGDL